MVAHGYTLPLLLYVTATSLWLGAAVAGPVDVNSHQAAIAAEQQLRKAAFSGESGTVVSERIDTTTLLSATAEQGPRATRDEQSSLSTHTGRQVGTAFSIDSMGIKADDDDIKTDDSKMDNTRISITLGKKKKVPTATLR